MSTRHIPPAPGPRPEPSVPPPPDNRTAALVEAIHSSHDHPNVYGCYMDRQTAAAILATLDAAGWTLASIEDLKHDMEMAAGAMAEIARLRRIEEAARALSTVMPRTANIWPEVAALRAELEEKP